MRNLRDLAADMEKLAGAIPAESNALKIKIATAILQDLIFHTPVDTSKAESNWQVSIGEPTAVAIDALVPGFKGSTQDASGEAALASGLAIIRNVLSGQSIWIQNVLPYIRRLNEGHSAQAPAGFVERSQLIGRKIAEQGLGNVRTN